MKNLLCGVLLFSLMSLVAAASQRSVFENSDKPESAKVTISAISTSTLAGSTNQEVYLADIVLKDKNHRLAKLVDLYPSYGSRIPVSILQERPLLKMRIVRDRSCDLTGSTFFLPSDEKLLFDASARTSLANSRATIVPCFKIDHNTIQFAK